MKKKMFMLTSIFLLLIVVGAVYLLHRGLKGPLDNPYKGLKTIKVDEFFDKQGEYYVYAQRSGCPYCDNVQDEIIEFSKDTQLYVLDTRAKGNEEIKDYNWDEHHRLYDKEIGEVVNGQMILYNNMKEEQLKTKYSPYDYTIKKADKDFAELNEDKKAGKIYAIRESPIIDYLDASEKNLIIAAVPTLFHIREGKVVEYYFGDTQILNLLDSSKDPIDQYMNGF